MSDDDNDPATFEWLKSIGLNVIYHAGRFRVRILADWLPLPDKITKGNVRTILEIFGGGE